MAFTMQQEGLYKMKKMKLWLVGTSVAVKIRPFERIVRGNLRCFLYPKGCEQFAFRRHLQAAQATKTRIAKGDGMLLTGIVESKQQR